MTAAASIGTMSKRLIADAHTRRRQLLEDRYCHGYDCGRLLDNPLTHDCGRPRCRAKTSWYSMTPAQQIQHAVNCGVGRKFIRSFLPSLAKFPVPKSCKADLEFTKSTFFCGPVNTGKSWALNCIACDALDQGFTIAIIGWQYFQMEVRSTYQQAAKQSELDIFNKYLKADVLCIDDIGVDNEDCDGRASQAARRLLYTLVDKRYWNNQITHFSSNLPASQLQRRYDARIARRITEMCQTVVLKDAIT